MEKEINYNRIKKAMEFIAGNLSQQPSIEEIAQAAGMSEFHFRRVFREWAGVSPKKFMQYLTLNELKSNIHKASSLSELSERTGLSSQSRVYDLFVKIEAVTPAEYRSGGAGLTVIYGIHTTPFGNTLVATSARGICAIEFFDDSETNAFLRLRQKWFGADIIRDQEATADIAETIFNKKGGTVTALLSGTPFQLKVWEALLKIPFGTLTTYSTVAEMCGSPKAGRAVGTAIGSNNIAWLIPCHRVIRSLGGIGGYKWGVDRKLAILGWERAVAENE